MTDRLHNHTSGALAGIAAERAVAIVGAGPSGCALAIRLAQRGVPVAVFDSGRRPALTVGESLVPAAMPHLSVLGVEDRVRRDSVHKPGALLVHGSGERVDFRFRDFGRRAPGYACNVARPDFDETLSQRARQLGVPFIARRAVVRAGAPSGAREVLLDEASCAQLGLAPGADGSTQPALLIDATGRARVFARRLGLSAVRGARDDVARFAHFTGMSCADAAPGQIVISILEHGWAWRIPLGDRVSVGVVAARDDDSRSSADWLAAAMRREPLLADVSRRAVRVSRAVRYEHYQLVGERAWGPGWAAVGDAFGFVDPMLSPGVFMALEGAIQLNDRLRIDGQGRPRLDDPVGYEHTMRDWFTGWDRVIETFYDGRMLALQRAARQRRPTLLHHFIEGRVRRAIALLVSGAGTRSRLAQQTLLRSAEHLLADAGPDERPARFAVRDAGSRARPPAQRHSVETINRYSEVA